MDSDDKTEAATIAPENAPAILADLHEDAYHGGPGISKTGLWTIYGRTPAHYRFGEREEKRHFALGQACHDIILRPDVFSATYVRGPDDRRGKKWSDFDVAIAAQGRVLLTSGEYDTAIHAGGELAAHPVIKKARESRVLHEPSAYWIDAETGVLCRCRPDTYAVDAKGILDLKTTTDASPRAFKRTVADYGYHVQDPFYSDGWTEAGGGDVDWFAFVTIEKTAPFATAVYELHPDAVDEGRAIYRVALRRYADCLKREEDARAKNPDCDLRPYWPGYPQAVAELALDRWAFRETTPTVETAA